MPGILGDVEDHSVPHSLRFPPPPAAWTHASDAELAAFVDEAAAWADRIVRTLRDDPGRVGGLGERGRRHFTAALVRERPPPDESDRFCLALFPAVTGPSRLVFEDLMEWRDSTVNFLVLDQDVINTCYARRDAFAMRTMLHPAGEGRCDVCVLPQTNDHRCPMDEWCAPPPSWGPVRPFPDALRFPAPPQGDGEAPARQYAAFVAAVQAWRGRVVAALRHERDTLPDTLTDEAAGYLLSCLDPEAPVGLGHIVPFPEGLTEDRRGHERALLWRDWLVGLLYGKWTSGDSQIRTSRDERVVRQFMRPPDGGDRCSLCLRQFVTREERWQHTCPARLWEYDGPRAVEGAVRIIPGPLRFPPPPVAWTGASDAMLAAFVAQVEVWRGGVARALRDDPDLAGRMTALGKQRWTDALLRANASDGGDEFRFATFPAATAASHQVFVEVMEWRLRIYKQLDLDRGEPVPKFHRDDATLVSRFLLPADGQRCEPCGLPLTVGHACPMHRGEPRQQDGIDAGANSGGDGPHRRRSAHGSGDRFAGILAGAGEARSRETAVLVLGGAVLCWAVVAPPGALRTVITAFGLLALFCGLVLILRRRRPVESGMR